MTRQKSYQQGYVSEPIRTRRGIAFKIRYRVRSTEGKWKQKCETLYDLPGKKAARAVLQQRLQEASAMPPETVRFNVSGIRGDLLDAVSGAQRNEAIHKGRI